MSPAVHPDRVHHPEEEMVRYTTATQTENVKHDEINMQGHPVNQ